MALTPTTLHITSHLSRRAGLFPPIAGNNRYAVSHHPTRHCESAGRTLQLKLPTKLAKPQILLEQESVRQVSRFNVVFRSVAIASWWDARVFSSFAQLPTSSGKVRPSTTVAHMTLD
jgi:hypothetical protein